MRLNRDLSWLACGLIFTLAAAAGKSQPVPGFSATDHAQSQVVAYLAKLAGLHCTETVLQEKLAGNGHVASSERAQYDYLVMIDGDGDGFQLNESRLEASGTKHKPLPMLVTNGFSTLLLVFHPYYRDGFLFEPGAEETVDGRTTLPIHFEHVSGRRTPAALALRGREYPLELQGTAWLDKQSGQVVKMDASLMRDMSDIGLRSLAIHVEYRPSDLGKTSGSMILPAVAVVDVTTPRQHWRNTHTFNRYNSFSTEAEQDPNVKVHLDKTTAPAGATSEQLKPDPKEKP